MSSLVKSRVEITVWWADMAFKLCAIQLRKIMRNSGYQYVVLEAPTGFGKSPVAVCVARTLGSSYLCSATKELQTQYMNNFHYFLAIKGMGEFTCLVREDFDREHNYRCPECGPHATFGECQHTTVIHAPCRSGQPGYVTKYEHGQLIYRGL